VTPVLLDTGVIVALLDRSERFHQTAASIVQGLRQPLVTCEAVLAEACYLLRNLTGAPEAVIENVEKGIFQIPLPLHRSAGAVRRILKKYRDMHIDLADACLIALAEELKTAEILTLDSDFKVYRWRTKQPFQLLIDF
jgi:predicted nucleic acid-binding protein